MFFYPPPYEREVWHYKLANSDCIQRAIKNFDLEKAFFNVDVNKKVVLFNETILNIICNFIPHEIVTCDDRDTPCMTRLVKSKDFKNNNSNLERLRSLQNNWINTIEAHNISQQLPKNYLTLILANGLS